MCPAADGEAGQGDWLGEPKCLNALGSHAGPSSAAFQCMSLCLCLFLGQRLRWERAVLKACECARKSTEPARASFYKDNLWLRVQVISISPLSIRNVWSCGWLSKTGSFVPSITNLSFPPGFVFVCASVCGWVLVLVRATYWAPKFSFSKPCEDILTSLPNFWVLRLWSAVICWY